MRKNSFSKTTDTRKNLSCFNYTGNKNHSYSNIKYFHYICNVIHSLIK